VLLISADGQTPLSKIRMPIKNVPLRGISHCHLHVRSPTADRKSSSYHAVSIEFGCPICRVARYEPNTEPLTVIINEDASIQQDSGGSLTGLDDSDTTGDLPVLDSVLRQYAARIRGGNSAPLVRVRLNDAVSYQRFIDVLRRLQDHGMIPEWFDADEELE
jgi:biopolymer transport protein ExbD